jgi:hypothetical protein
MAPAETPAPATRVASAAPNAQSDGLFSSLARKMGFGGSADTTASAQPSPAKPKVIEAKRNEPPRPEASTSKAVAATPKAADSKPETKQAAARPPLNPSPSDTAAASPAKDSQVAGSQPIVQAHSFESRFSAVK